MGADRCGECGFDFTEDRDSLLGRCEPFPARLEHLLFSVQADLLRQRPAPDVWSPLEYAAHTGEAVLWYAARIRRVLDEEFAQLEPFDWNTAAELGGYHQRSIDTVVADASLACGALAGLARSLSEEQLAREGVGSDGSPRSVEQLLARAGHELAHHELDLLRCATTSAQ